MGEARELVLCVEVERLRQEIDRLRAENSALRPLVSALQHKLRQMERHPDFPTADTEPLVSKNRTHG
jgi:hypothetical protein